MGSDPVIDSVMAAMERVALSCSEISATQREICESLAMQQMVQAELRKETQKTSDRVSRMETKLEIATELLREKRL